MPSPSRASLSVWGAACWWPELKAIPALSLGPRELLKRGASRLIPLVLFTFVSRALHAWASPAPCCIWPRGQTVRTKQNSFFLQATGC